MLFHLKHRPLDQRAETRRDDWRAMVLDGLGLLVAAVGLVLVASTVWGGPQ
jgi:hypothetical protein